eukprot:COSAG06_NODE_2839_length_6196_cov_2.423487_9_plen_77_part_01
MSTGGRSWAVRKTPFLELQYIANVKPIDLPRQARDNHEETAEKRGGFRPQGAGRRWASSGEQFKQFIIATYIYYAFP